MPTDPHCKNAPMMQLARAEAEEAEKKRQATKRIAQAWKAHEDRALAAAEKKVARDIVKRHVVAKITRKRFLELKEATIVCQAHRRGVLARKEYSEMWVKIAIKEGVGFLLGLRKAKFQHYYGFARREAAFVMQTCWHSRKARVRARERRQEVAKERLGVLLDLWDQVGLPLAERSRNFSRLLDSGLDSLRGLASIRAAVLQVANILPPQHLKAAAARQMFTFDPKYSRIVDTFPGDERRTSTVAGHSGQQSLTAEEIERRHLMIRNEREYIYQQLKVLPVRDMRLLYWEWGISLQEKSRMHSLVMNRLWKEPSRAEQSEALMKIVETLPPPKTSSRFNFNMSRDAAPLNYSHAMSRGAQSMRGGGTGDTHDAKSSTSKSGSTRHTNDSKRSGSPSNSEAWESDSILSRGSSSVVGSINANNAQNSGRSTSRSRKSSLGKAFTDTKLVNKGGRAASEAGSAMDAIEIVAVDMNSDVFSSAQLSASSNDNSRLNDRTTSKNFMKLLSCTRPQSGPD
uniref:Uncharacterized protein n=1 Tax=Polyblepharides amylifera TaxID=1486889 RepID=A0A7R9SWR8_9CHLO